MNQKSRRVLEYQKIIELLRQEAASSLGKEAVGGWEPLTDAWRIRERLAETTEAVKAISAKGAPPLGAFYDLENSLHLANKGGTLTMKQLLEVLYNLNTAGRMARYLQPPLPDLPVLQAIGEVLFTDRFLAEEIDRCILSEDEMADQASPELWSIRRAILRQNEALKSKMNQILNAAENRTMLQDALVTIRQGRYVIPVKQEHKGRFPGIVHDQSATGATLFIEPQAIVDLNNELRQLELSEQAEIQRILARLSQEVAGDFVQLMNNQRLLLQLDLIFARGRLSVVQQGAEPEMNDGGTLEFICARHPLIPAEQVIPITVQLGREYNTLVVTGPNTGGKTVTLKTVGLLAMMAQTGLHIPADPGSRMPIFQQIFADIGDEQSIEQSLSTFSSHMTNIAEIAEMADRHSLVLLDELGAGTDPTEGAALAIAVLEHLYDRGARTLATTHYTELKKYALAAPGVENASMEFDVETLKPTYRLFTGIPGKSNAFEISRRIGLQSAIIDKARSLIDRGDMEFEGVISSIEEDKKQAEAEREEAILLKIAIQRQKEELDRRESRLEEQQESILGKARQEAREMLREIREEAEQFRKELRQLEKAENAGDRRKALEAQRRQLKEAENRLRSGEMPEAPVNRDPLRREEAVPGQRVKIVHLNQNGEVLTSPDDRGELQVRVGSLKINVQLSQLAKIIDGTRKKPAQRTSRYGSLYRAKTQEISAQMDVRGQSLDDAVMTVDKYLDDAWMAGLPEVTVIHGRGEGILREGLTRMFRQHKHVTAFRKGSYHEGGDGVTICTLSARA